MLSTKLGSSITNTKMRDAHDLCDLTGMCTVCTSSCSGSCEIGLSAVRGTEAIYPVATDQNQFASNKKYAIDFSDFNINGHVFGGAGSFLDAKLNSEFGLTHKVPMKLPVIMPAMAKLNWKDYFAGAALAGISVVIGEDVIAKDKHLELKDGQVVSSPLIADMINAFRSHYHGYGDIILQANADDEEAGVLDYAIRELGVKSVELKFGQAAKGIQGVGKISNREDALKYKQRGNIVIPDPSDLENDGPYERIGKLPYWDEAYLKNRVAILRALGAERICFKTGPFSPEDLYRIVEIAVDNQIDLITVDGAGGGTGNSPIKMMNEWGIPTVDLITIMRHIYAHFDKLGKKLPQLAIGGGIVMEDQVFKALALGAPYVNFVAIGRGAMAAAMSAKQVATLISEGTIPSRYQPYGHTSEMIFSDYGEALKLLNEVEGDLSFGAIGVYSYMKRIGYGLKGLLALNRKFNISLINNEDIVAMTSEASKATGIMTYQDHLDQLDF